MEILRKSKKKDKKKQAFDQAKSKIKGKLKETNVQAKKWEANLDYRIRKIATFKKKS